MTDDATLEGIEPEDDLLLSRFLDDDNVEDIVGPRLAAEPELAARLAQLRVARDAIAEPVRVDELQRRRTIAGALEAATPLPKPSDAITTSVTETPAVATGSRPARDEEPAARAARETSIIRTTRFAWVAVAAAALVAVGIANATLRQENVPSEPGDQLVAEEAFPLPQNAPVFFGGDLGLVRGELDLLAIVEPIVENPDPTTPTADSALNATGSALASGGSAGGGAAGDVQAAPVDGDGSADAPESSDDFAYDAGGTTPPDASDTQSAAAVENRAAAQSQEELEQRCQTSVRANDPELTNLVYVAPLLWDFGQGEPRSSIVYVFRVIDSTGNGELDHRLVVVAFDNCDQLFSSSF